MAIFSNLFIYKVQYFKYVIKNKVRILGEAEKPIVQ